MMVSINPNLMKAVGNPK